MSVIKYIGRTNYFKGKTLWEIVGNLKDYGVGRVVVRSIFERYPEPSFMRILKVETTPNDIIYIKQKDIDVPQNYRKVKVWVENVFRGRKFHNPVLIYRTSYKADYRLLSKEEEVEYCKITKVLPERLVSNVIEFPPLLKEFILMDYEKKGLAPPEDLVLRININKSSRNFFRCHPEPKEILPMSVGKPASPELYSDIPLSG